MLRRIIIASLLGALVKATLCPVKTAPVSRESSTQYQWGIRYTTENIISIKTTSVTNCLHRCLKECLCYHANYKAISSNNVTCELVKYKTCGSKSGVVEIEAPGWSAAKLFKEIGDTYGTENCCQTTASSTSPTTAPSNNPCIGKPDGQYGLPDVFRYLECSCGQASFQNCTGGKIFVPTTMQCEVVLNSEKDMFCEERSDGNYRNPWNCNTYLACVTGHSVQEMPCPATLVYDPNNGICQYEYLMPCVQV